MILHDIVIWQRSTIIEVSEAPLPPPLSEICIPPDLTDLELFEKYCLPIGDRWDDVPYLHIDGGLHKFNNHTLQNCEVFFFNVKTSHMTSYPCSSAQKAGFISQKSIYKM